jgi:hypothetical protein
MRRWGIWAGLSAMMVAATGYAWLNFYAAADLGYDRYPGGKAILEFWGYTVISSFVGFIATGSLALYLRRRSRPRPRSGRGNDAPADLARWQTRRPCRPSSLTLEAPGRVARATAVAVTVGS